MQHLNFLFTYKQFNDTKSILDPKGWQQNIKNIKFK